MLSADIFRGRYRQSFDEPKPLAENTVLAYSMSLPVVNHTLQPGHRLMVQVQNSWFPLYDRNPQTFVPSIMRARPAPIGRSGIASTTAARRRRILSWGGSRRTLRLGCLDGLAPTARRCWRQPRRSVVSRRAVH